MFGSNYAQNFGLPGFPWTGMDPAGGMFAPPFSGMQQGQPVPGTPGAFDTGAASSGLGGAPAGGPVAVASQPDAGLGPSASPSVDALRSGNPLAAGSFAQPGYGGATDQFRQMVGAGAPSSPGAGAPGFGGRGV